MFIFKEISDGTLGSPYSFEDHIGSWVDLENPGNLLNGVSDLVQLITKLGGVEVFLHTLEGLSSLVLLVESLDFLLSGYHFLVQIRVFSTNLFLLLNKLVTFVFEFLCSFLSSLQFLGQYVLLPSEFLRVVEVTACWGVDGLGNFKVCWSEVIPLIAKNFLDFCGLSILSALHGLLKFLAHFSDTFFELSDLAVFLLAQKLKVSILVFELSDLLTHVPTRCLLVLLKPYDLHVKLIVLLHNSLIFLFKRFLILRLRANLPLELLVDLLKPVECLSCLEHVV